MTTEMGTVPPDVWDKKVRPNLKDLETKDLLKLAQGLRTKNDSLVREVVDSLIHGEKKSDSVPVERGEV